MGVSVLEVWFVGWSFLVVFYICLGRNGQLFIMGSLPLFLRIFCPFRFVLCAWLSIFRERGFCVSLIFLFPPVQRLEIYPVLMICRC